MEKLLFTVDEAGAALHLSRQSIYDLINSGELRSFTIGRSRRIPRAALDEFITERSELAAAGTR